jgi:DNA replication protein DnaC
MLNDALQALYAVNLGPMAEHLRDWVADASNARRSHTECVAALAGALLQHRLQQRTRSFQRKAAVPANVSLAAVRTGVDRGLTDYTLGNLGTCDWVKDGHMVVVTGPTQSGKSFLATALAQEAVLKRITTEYLRVPEWLAECGEAPTPKAALARIAEMAKVPLLVLDDFATEPATAQESHWLRRLIDARCRDKQKATVIVSPTPMEAWDALFDDPIAADAIVGRTNRALYRIHLSA